MITLLTVIGLKTGTEVSIIKDFVETKKLILPFFFFFFLQMTVVALDPGIATIAGGQGPGRAIVRGGDHVIVIMTGDDHAPGHVIVTMRGGDPVRDLEIENCHQSTRH